MGGRDRVFGDNRCWRGDRGDRRIEHGPAMMAVAAHAARGVAGRAFILVFALHGLVDGGAHRDSGCVGVTNAGGHGHRGREDKQRQHAGGQKATQVPPPCHRSTHGRSIASAIKLENALHDYIG